MTDQPPPPPEVPEVFANLTPAQLGQAAGHAQAVGVLTQGRVAEAWREFARQLQDAAEYARVLRRRRGADDG